MATDSKRFTISITPKMEADLDSARQRRYWQDTQNVMIRELSVRGLEEAAKRKRLDKAY